MKIRICPNASSIYIGRCNCHRQNTNWDWVDTLKKIEGMVLDVETEYLFKDQFNTAPIPGVSETGLRIMNESVEEVIGDERPGKMKCGWCGTTSPISDICPKCNKTEYLEPFIKELLWTGLKQRKISENGQG